MRFTSGIVSALTLWNVDGRFSAGEPIEEIGQDEGEFTIGKECWKHDNGSFCFDGHMFRSFYTEGGAIHYSDFIDGKLYMYSKQDIDQVFQMPDPSNRKLMDVHTLTLSAKESLKGIKYGCTVKDSETPVNVGKMRVLKTHGDGSSVWSLDHWVVPVDREGVPISISASVDGEPFMYISEKDLLLETIDGCDPEKESDDAPEVPGETAEIFHRTLLAHNPSISEEEYFSIVKSNEENRNQDSRELHLFDDFQKWASQTNWCGSAWDILNTECPDSTKSWPYDYTADHACRRHDHGSKSVKTSIFGLHRMECYVDKDLVLAGGHNLAVMSVYGPDGLFGKVLGCYTYDTYYCWVGWWFKNCGKKWHVRYGPIRYLWVAKKDGYFGKSKVCEGDLGGY